MTCSGATVVAPYVAQVEADVQVFVEAHMEAMLAVRFLASEYVIDCVDGGRIDSPSALQLPAVAAHGQQLWPEQAVYPTEQSAALGLADAFTWFCQ